MCNHRSNERMPWYHLPSKKGQCHYCSCRVTGHLGFITQDIHTPYGPHLVSSHERIQNAAIVILRLQPQLLFQEFVPLKNWFLKDRMLILPSHGSTERTQQAEPQASSLPHATDELLQSSVPQLHHLRNGNILVRGRLWFLLLCPVSTEDCWSEKASL